MIRKQTALALFLGLGMVAGAGASVVNIGPVVAPEKFSSFVSVSGAFSDTYLFSIGAPTFSSGAVTSLEMKDVWGITSLNVQLFSGKYYDGIPDTLVYTLTGTDITKTGSGTYVPGDYYYTISGIGNGGKVGGAGAGNYSFAVATAPVPEPESYAMLLAGLGLMATIARRRNQAKTR